MYSLYVCTYVLLLHQESFDMILINYHHFTMGVLQLVSEQCQN
jgi:hypothetical protein